MSKKFRKQAYRNRLEAIRCAATVMHGIAHDRETLMPLGWSLAVFFEKYLWDGADGTMKPFGPKKPKKLKVVGK